MADNQRRGFAGMDPEKQREIARKGGKAAHEKGTAHEFTPDEAREAGRRGGEAVSRDRAHMSRIGREGGLSSRGGQGKRNAGARSREEETSAGNEERAADQQGGAGAADSRL